MCERERERQREKGRERASAEGVHGTQIWKSEDNSVEWLLFLPLCGSRNWTLVSRCEQQAPLPTKLSLQLSLLGVILVLRQGFIV